MALRATPKSGAVQPDENADKNPNITPALT